MAVAARARALVARSIEVIARNQAASGAYVASPAFSQYGYCWFRDGSFIAHGMAVADQVDSAARFHDWAAAAVLRNADLARACVARAERGEAIDPARTLRARYPLEGADTADTWPNFQLDGFGTWLWSATAWLGQTGDVAAAARWRPALDLVAEYLGALWRLPNHDCWEENGERVNTTTLLALSGGLSAFARWSGDLSAARHAAAIRGHLLQHCVSGGRLRKFADSDEIGVDAAMLGAGMPYGVFQFGDPVLRGTLDAIERDLRWPGGGVRRYATDSYYGGGEWPLLTAWLGWYHAAAGDRAAAQACFDWVVEQARPNLDLAEQVQAHLIEPAKLPEWESRWGPVASPLLWSHAMLLILWRALDRGA